MQDWGRYLGDQTMATTILDRLMHRAAMLEFEGKSYRLKEAAARLATPPTGSQSGRPAWGNLGGHRGHRQQRRMVSLGYQVHCRSRRSASMRIYE